MTNNQRYQFYIGILVHKCLNGMAPTYLSNLLTFIRDLHEHNTHNEHLLLIPPSRTNAMKRSFTHSAASLWNKLPLSCYQATNFNHFKRVLKVVLLVPHDCRCILNFFNYYLLSKIKISLFYSVCVLILLFYSCMSFYSDFKRFNDFKMIFFVVLYH